MKKLDEYKEIIHKCSKCGLCQSVCPAYQTTGNECAVSRGQFIMLRGVINGDLKMNKNMFLRKFDEKEIFGYDLIVSGVDKSFLLREFKKAQKGEPTRDCLRGCNGCGLLKMGVCVNGRC